MTERHGDTGSSAKTKRSHRKGSSSRSLVPPSGAERTCVVTRQARSPDQLLPLALVGGHVVPGRVDRGRGAYVLIDREALSGLDARVLSRAFRTRIERFDPAGFLDACHEVSERKVLERIGLARAMGGILLGVESAASAGDDATVIVASDLSERSSRKIAGFSFISGEAVGASAGVGWVGAVTLRPGQLAEEASYWLRVWYETARDSSQEAREEAR